MKGKVIRIMIVILILICIPVVHAKEECTYQNKAAAIKEAKNVTAAYEIKQRDDGTYYVTITIYNITPDLQVIYYSSEGTSTDVEKTSNSISVFNFDTPDGSGIYTIEDNDIYKLKKYTISVKSTKYDCTGVLRRFSIIKPRYNKISEIEECQYYDVKDFLYCQEWVTSAFKLTEAGVAKQIQRQREINRAQMTTICYSCSKDVEYEQWLARFEKIKKYVIIGLSVGIVTDVVVIIFMIRKIREDSIV
jgi:hypothetical protein